jgi:hypothetical protein
VKFIQEINLQNEDYLVCFDVILFTSLVIVRNKLNKGPPFPEHSPLQVEEVMELLDICLTITYFQYEDKFYQQSEGMAMGNCLQWSLIYLWNTLRQ